MWLAALRPSAGAWFERDGGPSSVLPATGTREKRLSSRVSLPQPLHDLFNPGGARLSPQPALLAFLLWGDESFSCGSSAPYNWRISRSLTDWLFGFTCAE